MSEPAANQLIEHTCEVLDLTAGSLYAATSEPGGNLDPELWRTHGDWLLLANRMGAERVFFVGDDPVIVFTAVSPNAPEADLVDAYRRAWSLSRPRCLFVARGGELRVYALSEPPSLDDHGVASVSPIEIVEQAANVRTALVRFQRDRIEAGTTFEAKEFRSPGGRADHRLIADVTAATDSLETVGLDQATAHTLIERVILVRYLEDRKIIVPEYVAAVASQRPDWKALLEDEAEVPNFGAPSTFVRCLADDELTYAVFARLAADFNGDLFIADDAERVRVGREHLHLIKTLLEGTASAAQEPLFLWAYDFGVVPTSLISTMYEVFYQQDVASKLTGTHYTPTELVEFTLAQTLTDSVLQRQPKICDPACGSGIFLVEAFRMVVRYESARLNRRLTSPELREILLDRIAGIDLNEEAVRLAAFSLYLAYLNYQTPQDIREAGPLPRLICRSPDDRRVLVVSDAFAPTLGEEERNETPGLPWANGTFDVIVGNPPWTEPKAGDRGLPDEWAKRRKLEIGDRNRSQLFLWRALDLLNEQGIGAMLVAASAFVNKRSTSRAFRRAWLGRVDVAQIVNFAQVRRLFFTKAVAPFFLVTFRPRSEENDRQLVVYETAVPSPALKQTRSMAFARLDRRVVAQHSLEQHDHLWKVYSWGGHRDEALIARLAIEERLADVLPSDGARPGYGYQWGTDEPSDRLKKLPSLRTFKPWGELEASDFEDRPRGTKRQPDERMYEGQRILVKRGVSDGTFGPYSRLVEEPLSFRHQIYCIPLQGLAPWKARVIAGTLLSSLGRYHLFMMSSAWGLWYDQVYLNELLDLPLRLREDCPATARIVAVVDQLRELPGEGSAAPLPSLGIDPGLRTQALADLDIAVFDLFELGDDERDVVADFWSRFAERRAPSRLAAATARRGVAPPQDSNDVVSRYLQTFLRQWNGLLRERDAHLGWEVVRDSNVPVTAAVFRVLGADTDTPPESALPSRWREVLGQIAAAEPDQEGDERLYREGLIRAVSDDGIVIVKRDEARLWTRSAARDDAEATVLQAMRLQAR